MASRKPEDLRTDILALYILFQKKMREKGIDFILTCTARTQDEQLALYAQGRESLGAVNLLRHKAGLPPISQAENKKVTWTRESKHIVDGKNLKARAFDIVIISGGKIAEWNINTDTNKDGLSDYKQAAELWQSLDARCRSGFYFGDAPHFEIV